MRSLLAAWFPGGSPLSAADWLVFAALLSAAVWIGRRAARAKTTPADYRRARLPEPVLAAALLSSELSAAALVGFPALAFRGDWTYLQFFLGSLLGRFFLAARLLPAYFRDGEGATMYAYLGRRFGPRARSAGAGLFLLARGAGAAARLLIAASAAGALLGWSATPTILLLAAVSAAALGRGGVRSAAWLGAFKAAAVLIFAAATAAFIVRHVDGGLGGAWSAAAEAGKLRLWRASEPGRGGWTRAALDPRLLWVAVIDGFFGAAGWLGVDYESAQKLLCAPDLKSARRTLLWETGAALAASAALLGVGTLMFVYYKQNPGLALPGSLDQIYPHFVAAVMPRAWRGAALGVLALGAADLPLASMSAVFAWDAPPPAFGYGPSEEERLADARRAALAFAAASAALALLFARWPSGSDAALRLGAVVYGPLLGVFLLGVFTREKSDGAAAAAAGAAAAFNGALVLWAGKTAWAAGWGWLAPLGAAAAFLLGRRLSREQ